jgi:uncharacterized protein (TIGR00730 family)
MRRVVSVFGSSHPPQGSPAYEEARLVGRLLAEAGFVVCNGGYGGTMEAASRGAKEIGGETWGVTLDLFGAARTSNAWLDRVIPSKDFPARLRRLTTLADAYIALAGGIGTLLEIALVWNSIFTGAISPRPAVLVGDSWRKVVDYMVAEMSITREQANLLRFAEDGRQAVEMVVRELGAGGRKT